MFENDYILLAFTFWRSWNGKKTEDHGTGSIVITLVQTLLSKVSYDPLEAWSFGEALIVTMTMVMTTKDRWNKVILNFSHFPTIFPRGPANVISSTFSSAPVPIKTSLPRLFVCLFVVGLVFYEPKAIKFKVALCKFLQLCPLSLWTCYEQDLAVLFPLEGAHKVLLSSCSKEAVSWNQPHSLMSSSPPQPLPFVWILLLVGLRIAPRWKDKILLCWPWANTAQQARAQILPLLPLPAPLPAAPSCTPFHLQSPTCAAALCILPPLMALGKSKLQQARGNEESSLLHTTVESLMQASQSTIMWPCAGYHSWKHFKITMVWWVVRWTSGGREKSLRAKSQLC